MNIVNKLKILLHAFLITRDENNDILNQWFMIFYYPSNAPHEQHAYKIMCTKLQSLTINLFSNACESTFYIKIYD